MLKKLDPTCVAKLCDYKMSVEKQSGKNEIATITAQKGLSQLVEFLLQQRRYHDAILLFSFGLPVRERVWWSYLAALRAEGKESSEDILAALTVIRQWAHQPEASLATQAQAMAEKLASDSATRWSALALFWSGENISYKNKKPVKANPMMAQLAVANAVIYAAEQGQERDRDFVTLIFQGAHIAMGSNGELHEKNQAFVEDYLKKLKE